MRAIVSQPLAIRHWRRAVAARPTSSYKSHSGAGPRHHDVENAKTQRKDKRG